MVTLAAAVPPEVMTPVCKPTVAALVLLLLHEQAVVMFWVLLSE